MNRSVLVSRQVVRRYGVADTVSKLWRMSKLKADPELVGEDDFGNLYFQTKRPAHPGYDRWVEPKCGKSDFDASVIPPEWHMWLHKMVDDTPQELSIERKDWFKKHKINYTGTNEAYRPQRFLFHKRRKVDQAFEEWTP